MSDEKKKPVHPAHFTTSQRDVRGHPVESEKDVQGLPETNFLPPLKMVLAFINQDDKDKNAKLEGSDERNVEKLIEKLSEKEDE